MLYPATFRPGMGLLVLLESHSINKEDCSLIPAHLLRFDNSLMEKNPHPQCSWSGLHIQSLRLHFTHTLFQNMAAALN